MTQTPEEILDENAAVLEAFVSNFVNSPGVQLELYSAVGWSLHNNIERVSIAIRDVCGPIGTKYSVNTVIRGAASLKFLVNYARKVNQSILPRSDVPTDEVVEAALTLFRKLMRTVD